MPQTIGTNFDYTEIMRIRVDAIVALLRERLSLAGTFKWHRPVVLMAPKPTKFPCVMVQPMPFDERKKTTAKYDFVGQVAFYCYASANDPASAGDQSARMASALGKLFSDNALDDRTSDAPSRLYFRYPGFWIMSKFGPVSPSPVLAYGREQEARFLVCHKAMFEFTDILIH